MIYNDLKRPLMTSNDLQIENGYNYGFMHIKRKLGTQALQ